MQNYVRLYRTCQHKQSLYYHEFLYIIWFFFFFFCWKKLRISNRLIDRMSLSQAEKHVRVSHNPFLICTWVHAHNIKCGFNCSIINVLCFPLLEHWFCLRRNSTLSVITLLSAWNYFERVLWNCSHTVFHLSIIYINLEERITIIGANRVAYTSTAPSCDFIEVLLLYLFLLKIMCWLIVVTLIWQKQMILPLKYLHSLKTAWCWP